MNLSKNFTLNEMLESQTARRNNIAEQFNPSKETINNLKALCENILQPLRDSVGGIIISSGYRCVRTNSLTGGSGTSQHLLGQAVDIFPIVGSNANLFKKIIALKLPFDQLLWEFGTKQEPAWVHVSFSSRNRRQILYLGV